MHLENPQAAMSARMGSRKSPHTPARVIPVSPPQSYSLKPHETAEAVAAPGQKAAGPALQVQKATFKMSDL